MDIQIPDSAVPMLRKADDGEYAAMRNASGAYRITAAFNAQNESFTWDLADG